MAEDVSMIEAALGLGGLWASNKVAPGYLSRGAQFSAGFMPESFGGGEAKLGAAYTPGIHVMAPGADPSRSMHWGASRFEQRMGRSGFALPKQLGADRASTSFMGHTLGKGWSAAGSALGPMMSAYFVYAGYRDDGMRGAFDAGVWDLAMSAGIQSQMFKTAVMSGAEAVSNPKILAGMSVKQLEGAMVSGSRVSVTRARFGMLGMVRTGIGAGIGASIGQEYLGVPGAFVGGFGGAALARNPYVAVGAAVTLGGAAVISKGAYSLLKTGYRRRQRRRRIDTAGDTASFFTQNAMTMRSRSVQAMRNSHMNARSALGQEAGFMHSNRNYFSSYRYHGQ